MRTGSLITVAVLAAAGCKDKPADDEPRRPAEGPVVDPDPEESRRDGLAACAPALGAARTDGLGALLASCTPCGVSWQPLIALSGFDPEAPPADLPQHGEVLAVLDACKATCTGSARTSLTEILRDTQMGKSPSKPWRKIAADCRGALELDDRTRRFARGTWYAASQIAKALWAEGVPQAVAAARDAGPLDFPLPPFSEASTALAVPRSDQIAPAPPRLHVTIDQQSARIGALPHLRLAGGAATLAPAPGEDYPGALVPLEDLDQQLAALVATATAAPHAYDLSWSPTLIAPRGMPASRLLEVLGRMPGSRAYLAATRPVAGGPWPEPIGSIPIFVSTAPPFPDLPILDASDPGFAAAVSALPSTASAVRLTFAADATVDHVAAALTAIAAHGLDRASLELKPPPP